MKNKKILSIIVICLIVVFTTTPLTVFAEQDDNVGLYDVIIEDNAELLSDEEEVNLREKMLPISQYGNVAFITTSEKNYSTEDFTRAYFRNHFGTSSGTVFAIDMYNREIYIFNDGKINDAHKNAPVGTKKFFECFTQIFTTNYDYNIENIIGRTDSVCHLHGEFNQLSPKYNVNSIYYTNHKAECDNLIAKKVPCMDHIYSSAVMSWSWLDKYGELIEPDTRKKEELFKSISGQVEILGLSPNNDEHLFLLLS